MSYHQTNDEQRWDRICNRAHDLAQDHPKWSAEKVERVAIAEVDLADSVMAQDGHDDGSEA